MTYNLATFGGCKKLTQNLYLNRLCISAIYIFLYFRKMTKKILSGRRAGTLAACLLLMMSTRSNAQVKILFDATKAEMAGNADWVIDYDATTLGVGASGAYTTSSGHQSNPQQIPTPAQSGITASTAETYWSGALSSWAVDCVKKGYTVETLPWNGSITYGSTTNAQDLSNYKVFVIDEPNFRFSAAEKTAIMQFVQNGGGLFMISDHNNSDRNGDGWDSPHIWDDFLSNNSVQNYPFGIYFDTVDFSQTSTNISAAATDSIIHGPMGNVAEVQWSNGTTMTLNPTVNASVKGVVYKTGTTPGNTNAMVAYARYGSGKVAAMGDSSPADDGTGNPTCSLYNGYWSDAAGNHRLLIMNMTIWLAETTGGPTEIKEIAGAQTTVKVFPNPSTGALNVSADRDLTGASVVVYDVTGNIVAQQQPGKLDNGSIVSFKLAPGFYLVKLLSNEVTQTSRFAVY